MITHHLPTLSAQYAARTLHFCLEPEKEKHGHIWSFVFRDLAWVNKVTDLHEANPTLLGSSIGDFYNNAHLLPKSFSKATLWVLLMGPVRVAFSEEISIFWNCLQPHWYDEESYEVHFVSGVTLNVSQVVAGVSQELPLQPKRLFARQSLGAGLISYYVCWIGPSKLYTLGSERVLGVGGVAKRLSQIAHACRLAIDGNGQECMYDFYGNGSDFYVQKVYNNEQSLVGYEKRAQARRLKGLGSRDSDSC